LLNRCGKTTLAKLIAEKSSAIFREMSATSSGVNEVKTVVEEAKKSSMLLGRQGLWCMDSNEVLKSDRRTILFLDEIHRFNKAQQVCI